MTTYLVEILQSWQNTAVMSVSLGNGSGLQMDIVQKKAKTKANIQLSEQYI